MSTTTDNHMTEEQLEERYTEMLDDTVGLIQIGNLSYLPSEVLKNTDPIAYRVGMADYADSLLSDDDTLTIEGYSS